jgi:hypothetical protein
MRRNFVESRDIQTTLPMLAQVPDSFFVKRELLASAA